MQDPLVNFLMEQGSTGLVQTNRNLRAFFPNTAHNEELKRAVRLYLRRLRELTPGSPVGRMRWRILPDRNWQEGWRKHFKPQTIGKRFIVTPPWMRPRTADRQVIVIEPAMAFGTGTHETTRSCLELIETACAESLPSRALDVGTGSGILAIALAKLGVRKVLALDNDPVALDAAAANVTLNGVRDAVTLSRMELRRMHQRFPLVVANIIMDTLIELSGPLSRSVGARGTLILSGVLDTQIEAVMRHFERFAIARRKNLKEWSTVLLRRVS